MSLTKSPSLSPEQVAQYGRDGYTLWQQPVFAPEKFARLQSIFEENLARYGEDNLDRIHARDERLLEFLLADEVLDLIEPLIGPNIGLWSSHFISKPPFKGKATPWHEDSSYWNGRISTMEGICTLWLALDEGDAENGAMKVIPGTHFNGFSEYESVDAAQNIFTAQIKPEMVDAARAVTFALHPNACSLHEARIIHGADANTSPRRLYHALLSHDFCNRRWAPTKNSFPRRRALTEQMLSSARPRFCCPSRCVTRGRTRRSPTCSTAKACPPRRFAPIIGEKTSFPESILPVSTGLKFN